MLLNCASITPIITATANFKYQRIINTLGEHFHLKNNRILHQALEILYLDKARTLMHLIATLV